MTGVRVLVGTRRVRSSLPQTAAAGAGTWPGRCSLGGRSTISRDRHSTLSGYTRPSPRGGSARSSSDPTTGARPGKRSATTSPTTGFPVPTSGTTGPRTPGSSPGYGTWSRH